MSTEVIVAIITAVTSIIGTVMFNSRKNKTLLQKEFESLVNANRNFREEIRSDLLSAKEKISCLERYWAKPNSTIMEMGKELEIAKTTIIRLESELKGKNELINVLTRSASK
jgi:DNA-binding XRE family transcriptional regulator